MQVNKETIDDITIFKTIHGSRAYGLATETSDTDFKGIAIPPEEYFLGAFKRFEQYEEGETTIYDIRKFFKLAADCNPNIIEILYTDPKYHLFKNEIADEIIANRDLFLSKKAKFTFTGYAYAQLKRIETHKHWLMNPVTVKPKRSDYELDDTKAPMSNDEFGILNALVGRNRSISEATLAVFNKERAYRLALKNYNNYEEWKQNRNPARAELERKFGYDTKNALHLCRLMRMGKEILTTGQVIVERPDREELLAIRNGAWPYEKVIEYARVTEAELTDLYDKCTVIRHHPDFEKLNELCINLVKKYNGGKHG